MKKLTKPTSITEVQRKWYLFDAHDQVLGRLSVKVTAALMGKNKPNFVRHLDCGDNVVVINAEKVRVTGKKETEKIYKKYSGYPGGLKQKPLWKVREEKPQDIIRSAVYGMLPKNKLRDRLITRLYVVVGDNHPYKSKFNNQ